MREEPRPPPRYCPCLLAAAGPAVTHGPGACGGLRAKAGLLLVVGNEAAFQEKRQGPHFTLGLPAGHGEHRDSTRAEHNRHPAGVTSVGL